MKKTLFYLFVLAFIAACEGPDGPEGPAGAAGAAGTAGLNSLVAIVDEPAGDNCTTGGVKITTGLDANSNGTLDESEISATRYVCGGGDSEGGGPKEIRLADFGIFSKIGQDGDEIESVYADFDIANFPGYTVQFVLKDVEVTDDDDQPSAVEFVVDAVDTSNDNATIDGSQVTVNNGDYVSPDFLANVPTGKFDLGIRAHTADNSLAQIGCIGYLVLYKTN